MWLMSTVFATSPWDLGSIIPETQKMILDAVLPSTQHYKVRVKGKVKQSWELNSTLPYTSV